MERFTPHVRILEGEQKKDLPTSMDYVGIPFHRTSIILKYQDIYDGNCVSLICEAKEVLIEDIFPQSVFVEYSDAEDSD